MPGWLFSLSPCTHLAASLFIHSQPPPPRRVYIHCFTSHPLPAHCNLGPTHHSSKLLHLEPLTSSSFSSTAWWPVQLLTKFYPLTSDSQRTPISCFFLTSYFVPSHLLPKLFLGCCPYVLVLSSSQSLTPSECSQGNLETAHVSFNLLPLLLVVKCAMVKSTTP